MTHARGWLAQRTPPRASSGSKTSSSHSESSPRDSASVRDSFTSWAGSVKCVRSLIRYPTSPVYGFMQSTALCNSHSAWCVTQLSRTWGHGGRCTLQRKPGMSCTRACAWALKAACVSVPSAIASFSGNPSEQRRISVLILAVKKQLLKFPLNELQLNNLKPP